MNITIGNSVRRLRELLAGTDPVTQTVLRILAAVFGGYALNASVLTALALLLPWPKVEILFFTALFSALIYPAVLLWVFAAPTAQRAWRDLLNVILLSGLLALVAAWTN
ncbi:hypothetical protein [Sporomusa termitida]|uniref:Uncharacterized protein n=1 Tax=Sporomusa termitida TaxID=2377 RepID=A0A517E001_9FIRM|nr:hypothetical protein [Sporomusa termitida]QDR82930.1 hypothetical protein SPTER_43790 [Sporomusa termitida]